MDCVKSNDDIDLDEISARERKPPFDDFLPAGFRLNEENLQFFCALHYLNKECLGEEEFYQDLRYIQKITRMIRRASIKENFNEHLLFNHLIVFSNLFTPECVASVLFFKTDKAHWPTLKTFLEFLSKMPEKVYYVGEKPLINTDISLDKNSVQILRAFNERIRNNTPKI